MAYNYGFPVGYQPTLYQGYQGNNFQNGSGSTGSLIWVQGEAGAKSYMVAPNSTVVLFDSENQAIYLKSADASGMPSMKILDYKIRDAVEHAETPLKAPEQYVTVDSMAEMEKRLLERIKRLEEGVKE